jgi:hypothetical protein
MARHGSDDTDKGATLHAVDGTAVTLPLIHPNTTARALLTTGVELANSGIINRFGLDIDTSGRPRTAMTRNDGTDININHMERHRHQHQPHGTASPGSTTS